MAAVVSRGKAAGDIPLEYHTSVNPFFLAMSKFRRRRWQEAIDICSDLLKKNPRDESAWFLKCRALTMKNFIDDLECDEDPLGDLLMEDNVINSAPRPGTSLMRASGRATGKLRPTSASGRPITGFARPGTNSNYGVQQLTINVHVGGRVPQSATGRDQLTTALQQLNRGVGGRPMTSSMGRPTTSLGRLVGQQFVHNRGLAKALMDYLVFVLRDVGKAAELASEATKHCDYEDWWWKARLGKCYFHLGLLRDAEKQLLSALKASDGILTSMELARVYLKLDQPLAAIDAYKKSSLQYPGDPSVRLGIARVAAAIGDEPASIEVYKEVLHLDPVNCEAIASLAAHHFYNDQPEVALRYYRRLLQLGVLASPELWNNLGLCCFYGQHYDLCLTCMERALMFADDKTLGDVWYNIGHIGIGVGDLDFAYQAFKVSVSYDSSHAESLNNLGVLELRKGNVESAKSLFHSSMGADGSLHEPSYNASLTYYDEGNVRACLNNLNASLDKFPEHAGSNELMNMLKEKLMEL
ncbi:Tetratricopeptide repeat protein, putative [Perkinsus marinus ATCC 50983]|uniref:Tetratricopeptide repeat protein, putative n=1 Tax=Perkinsus marinus (strain ATCC 50983 / TXsc) TaxID=423536 RepID=C5KB09_PERM5|nr:Tetratricopeptide repeat protein, putative [Perkinsus marinus ATCC 50983]EER18335.1 Tetratricopeptide repeat protein, putative [Perkinsus marinus ATCC 50983]|eukprot:XP_002786539.1 Tetratricopeptide repeat protein, putative [Perkinsus marinus ATCC 50983]